MEMNTQPLIVVDRRPVSGRSLCCWIQTLEPELESVLVDSIDRTAARNALDNARAVIWASSAPVPWNDEWLLDEITRTLTRLRDVPIVLIADSADDQLAEEAALRLQLSGYIPTSTNLELAATALRLVLAGGRYFPNQKTVNGIRTPTASPQAPHVPYLDKLTTRERAVLDLLERGLPNKIIAYRLGMSQSTVKAHVHNIIAKLNVRNRTEAAMARYMEPATAAEIRAGW